MIKKVLKGIVGFVVVVLVVGAFMTSEDDGGEGSETVDAEEVAQGDVPEDKDDSADEDIEDAIEDSSDSVEDASIPREHKNALRSAENYLRMMPFSKAGLFEQLTSSYGDDYPEEAAQYAVDNVETDWNANALKAAENYLDMMPMSDSELYDQLISEYGDKYTQEQAQYAIDNLAD